MEEKRLTLYWANVLQITGIGYGYTVHQRSLRQALEQIGVHITSKQDEADIAVTIMPAGNFTPVEGKYNVLYTMYECVDIPNSWVEKLDKADLIVVPCTHNKRLFSRYTDKPVEVCWEGVDVESYKYKERKKEHPFIFLWVGASNERKGYVHTIAAWKKLWDDYPEIAKNCGLIMKTTQQAGTKKRIIGYEAGAPIYVDMPNERVFFADAGNAIVDTRDLSLEMMVKMYHYAHCFLFPTEGEGFGLTLAEAMATGLPCIYTPWSGPCDFISAKEGYPLKFRMTKVRAMTPTEEGWRIDLESKAASADIAHLTQRMVQVYSDYDTALAKGKKATERIRSGFTWEISARRFVEIINTHYKEQPNAGETNSNN